MRNYKSKSKKISFEDAIKEFNFNQFYEICKIFHIDVVDREVFGQLAAEARETGNEIDLSKVKMRRDFDKMTKELIKEYNKLPRRNRRQIDPIIAKIVWGNRQAQKIGNARIVEQYNEGVKLFETNELSKVESDDGVKLEKEIDIDKIDDGEMNAVDAAEPSGDDN